MKDFFTLARLGDRQLSLSAPEVMSPPLLRSGRIIIIIIILIDSSIFTEWYYIHKDYRQVLKNRGSASATLSENYENSCYINRKGIS